MKILVFGAGAVGSTVGGMLARAGHDVTLVGRNPHIQRIVSSGLKISGLWGDHTVQGIKAGTEIPQDAAPDWILLTTKAYDTENAARTLGQRFPKDAPVLHLQNGVGNAEILIQHLGEPRVISGMVIIGFQIPLAGRTVVTVSADKIRIGRKSGKVDESVRTIVEAFNAGGMPAEAVSDIQTQLWGKVLYNASLNALAGILGVKYGDLLDPHPWAIIHSILNEAFAALNAAGQPVPWSSATVYLEHLRTFQVPATFDHKPSMLSDLHHGRRTEVDFINGALTALGRKHGVAMPVNDTLIAMIHALEANGLKGILHPSLQPTDAPAGS
jgi:2-dehydropantoate 2-reductase